MKVLFSVLLQAEKFTKLYISSLASSSPISTQLSFAFHVTNCNRLLSLYHHVLNCLSQFAFSSQSTSQDETGDQTKGTTTGTTEPTTAEPSSSSIVSGTVTVETAIHPMSTSAKDPMEGTSVDSEQLVEASSTVFPVMDGTPVGLTAADPVESTTMRLTEDPTCEGTSTRLLEDPLEGMGERAKYTVEKPLTQAPRSPGLRKEYKTQFIQEHTTSECESEDSTTESQRGDEVEVELCGGQRGGCWLCVRGRGGNGGGVIQEHTTSECESKDY